jgi:hypothetical protein
MRGTEQPYGLLSSFVHTLYIYPKAGRSNSQARQVFMRPAAAFINYICNTKISELGQLSRHSNTLRAGRSGNRIPVGTRFFAPVQTGPGAHSASYTMGTGSFPGVKRPGRDVFHPPPSSAEVKEKVRALSAFVACSRVNLTFNFKTKISQ